jgi:hypothetical protein
MPVLGGLAFFAVLGAGLWGAAWWLSRGKVDVRIASAHFDSLFYEREAVRIRDKGPQLYPGLIGKDRGYIYVSHVGDDATKGWHAFSAVRDGQEIRCSVVWKPADAVFVDPCDNRRFPPTGEGLRQFDALANSTTKRLVIDLTTTIP